MRDIIEILERWTGEGASVALGSVVERIGSAPRDPGAALAVSSKREIAGGVTGGCVEPAVIREANEVLNGSRGKLVHYGLDDEDGFDVGLTCGGKIAVRGSIGARARNSSGQSSESSSASGKRSRVRNTFRGSQTVTR